MSDKTIPLKWNNPFKVSQLPLVARLYKYPYDNYGSLSRIAIKGLPNWLAIWMLQRLPIKQEGIFRWQGKSIEFNGKNTQFSSIYRKSAYEPVTAALLEHFIDPTKLFIDVGCNWGHFILHSLAQIQLLPPGNVYGFEPNFGAYRDACDIKGQLGLDYNLSSYVLGEANGRVRMSSLNSLESGLYTINPSGKDSVYMTTLDHWRNTLPHIKTGVGCIKIDAEGSEFRVLAGAKQILEKDRPVIIFESAYDCINKWQVYNRLCNLESLGYNLYLPLAKSHELLSTQPTRDCNEIVLQKIFPEERFQYENGLNLVALPK